MPDDLDDDDRPRPRRRDRDRDEDDFDDRPRRRRRDDDYDDEDDRPRARRLRDEDTDDEYDDRPRRRRPANDPFDDPAMGLVLPVNTNGLAIAAGYMGLFAVLCVPAPLALVLGVLAIRQLRRNPKQWGWGRAIFGIVMGGIGTALMLVIAVAAALGNMK
ncbi:MAG: DUF4190 domain-containing protein [Gemmataceae bacterium]|nr:DUF4190 domain-containing protein [Gemmataceae bacterium]